MTRQHPIDLRALRAELEREARALGFNAMGVAGIELGADERRLQDWLAAGQHGEMHYMARHGTRRSRPAELLPGTLRVLSVRMDYWPAGARDAAAVLADPAGAYVSRYALGRDYHKVLRGALKHLAATLQRCAGAQARVFVDSAPVLEKALARAAGLGWIGKHTNLIARDAGSYFFLGEIYTDVPLPLDAPTPAHCGSCSACLDACPTGAIVAPGVIDGARCLAWVLQKPGIVPVELRAAAGDRLYGCDDCQEACPPTVRLGARYRAPEPVERPSAWKEVLALLTGSDEEVCSAWGRWYLADRDPRWVRRNALIVLGNTADPADPVLGEQVRRVLGDYLAHHDPVLRTHAEWAAQRLGITDPSVQP